MKLIKVSYAIEEPLLKEFKETINRVKEVGKRKINMTDVVRDAFERFIKKNK